MTTFSALLISRKVQIIELVLLDGERIISRIRRETNCSTIPVQSSIGTED